MSLRKKVGVGVIIALSLVVWTGMLMTKGRYHEDEVYTISSAVSPIWDEFLEMKTEDDMPIVKTREEYQSYVAFRGLDLPLVYGNQWVDVHPPLYYLLLHVLMAMIPFATLQAGYVLNIIFFLMMDVLILAILGLLKKEKAQLPALILMNLTMLGVDMIAFQRMYVVVAFFVLLTAYLTLKIVVNGLKVSWKEMILLGATVMCGFLTQYFYVLFVIPLFVVVGWKMIKSRQWQDFWRYFGAHAGAAVLGVAMYAVCIEQILFSYRGIGAMAETTTGRYDEIFSGGYLVFLVVILALGGVAVWYDKRMWKKEEERTPALMLTIPVMVYLVVVLVVAPYLDLRYFMPVAAFPVMWLAVLGTEYLAEVKHGEALMVAGCGVVAAVSLLVSDGAYLFRDYQKVLEVAETHSEDMMVYVTHYGFNALQNIKEYLVYDESVIVENDIKQMGYLSEILREYGEDEFVLRIDNWVDGREAIVQGIENEGWKVKETVETWPYPTWVMVRK